MRELEIFRAFYLLRKEQWLSPGEIRNIQREKISGILKSASKTRHYSSIRLSDDPFSDLEQIPITTKQEIQKDISAFLTRDRKSLYEMRTSGSSGDPLRVYENQESCNYGTALRFMNLYELGRRPRDLIVELSHKKEYKTALQSLGLFRHRMLSLGNSEEANYARLCRLKPDILGFYPTVIASLARLNMQGEGLGLKSVFCGAEPLTDKSREIISESFSCPVFNLYGTTEFGPVAWECPEEHSLHVNAGSVFLEILDDSGKPLSSGEGNLAITTLRNHAMPLLRYDIGDRASWGGECPCRRGLPVLKTLQGRSDDYIVLPSGRVRSPLSVNMMDDLLYLKLFQIIQKEADLFIFLYIPLAEDLTESQREEIRSRIVKGCLDEEIKVEFERVEKIPRGSSGKMKLVVSRLSQKEI